MANILPSPRLYPGKTRSQYYPGEKRPRPSPAVSVLTSSGEPGQFLDGGGGNPYKLPQRNDAEDGPVRNFIARELVIVGGRTAGDG
jgi:hypothetical protein